MTYLLDTNACIRYLNGRSDALKRRIEATSPTEIAVCSIVKAELFFGAQKGTATEKTLELQRRFLTSFISLSFDDAAAESYARIRATLERRGTPIGANDLLIASIAMANGLTLVTHNTQEFERIPGLSVEDWEIAG